MTNVSFFYEKGSTIIGKDKGYPAVDKLRVDTAILPSAEDNGRTSSRNQESRVEPTSVLRAPTLRTIQFHLADRRGDALPQSIFIYDEVAPFMY